MQDCINMIFPNQITLKINKRLKSDEDRNIIANLKKDIFNRNKDIIEIFKQYGFKIIDNMTQLTTDHNICYFQYRGNIVNKWVQTKINKPRTPLKSKEYITILV